MMNRPAALISVIVLTALSAIACATHGTRPARPEPFPRPGVRETPDTPEAGRPDAESVTALSQGPRIVAAALDLRGTPYAAGGSTPDGFDCSGFVQYVFGEFGVALPRTVTSQFDATVEVPLGSLLPGDLLFFDTSGGQPSHVGIAIGDGTFVHAPSSRGVVRVESLASPYWRERFDSARRVR